jgi:hypothetical protein
MWVNNPIAGKSGRALCVAAHPDDGIHPDEAGALREEEK